MQFGDQCQKMQIPGNQTLLSRKLS